MVDPHPPHIPPDYDGDYRVPYDERSFWMWRAGLLCLLMLAAGGSFGYGVHMNIHCGVDRAGLCRGYSAILCIIPSAALALMVVLVAALKYRMLHPWVRRVIVLVTAIMVGTFIYLITVGG